MDSKANSLSSQTGLLIKDFREKQGFTQKQLGNSLGVTRQAIYAVEQGHRRLTLEHLDKILDILGYQLEILPRSNNPVSRSIYPLQSLTEVAQRVRASQKTDFRYALRELYRYIAHKKDPLSIMKEPVSSGDRRRDAYLAGVAEGIARYYNWAVPHWVNRDYYILSEPYFPGAPEGMKIPLLQISPAYFRVKNIFVDDSAVVGSLKKFKESDKNRGVKNE